VERLIISPDPKRPGQFRAVLESSGQFVVESSRQPLVDGARKLLELEFCPTDTLTMRHLGRTYDSFPPAPLKDLAKITFTEGERQTLQRRKWIPFAGSAVRRTETSAEPLPG
jgi:hypothetical protein